MARIPAQHELNDGAKEVIEQRPARKRPKKDSPATAAKVDPGGRMKAMRDAGTRHRQEFILVRTPRGAAKIALPHFDMLKLVWRLWLAKRVALDPDPGVSQPEIVEASGLPQNFVANVLQSLKRNEAIRSVVSHVGWRGTRAKYYPTIGGEEILRFADYLGRDSYVQVGRSMKAWRARNQDGPSDMFRYAAFLKSKGETGSK